MEDYVKAYNEMMDAYEDHEAEIQQMKFRIADLEDLSQRNNIKFRGILETVYTAELVPYLHQLLSTVYTRV